MPESANHDSHDADHHDRPHDHACPHDHKPREPDAPTGTLGGVAWFAKWLSTLTPERLIVLLLLAGVCWLAMNGKEEAKEMRDMMAAEIKSSKLDKESAEERHRQDLVASENRFHQFTLETLRTAQTNCNEQERARRVESVAHMKTAMDAIDGLRAAIDRLNKKTAGTGTP